MAIFERDVTFWLEARKKVHVRTVDGKRLARLKL